MEHYNITFSPGVFHSNDNGKCHFFTLLLHFVALSSVFKLYTNLCKGGNSVISLCKGGVTL